MNDVFISYSRRDKIFTQKLYEALKAVDRIVWADWDSIPAASDWDAEIKQGIQETNSVLFVLSPEWIKSNECRKELVHAVTMGKRLFPILYLPVDPNDVPPELAKINWVYMRDSDDFDKAFQTLCSAMDTDLDWIKTHTRIQVRALEWEKKSRDHSFVLRGNDLTEGEQFISGATGKSPEPTHLQGEYILASRTDATKRQRQTLAGVAVALVVSIALGIVALFQRQEAVKQAQVALARQLSVQAQSLFSDKPQVAIPLAVLSRKLDISADASQILQSVSLPSLVSQKKHNGPVHSIAFRPDGNYVASEGCDEYNEFGVCVLGSAHIWSVTTGEDISSMTYDGEVFTVMFSPDGRYVISEGCDERDADNQCIQGSVRVWEITTGKELSRMTHKGWVLSVAFSMDGKYAASGGADGILHIWDVSTGEEIISIIHQSAINSVAFNPDGTSIVSADESNAHVWEISTGIEIMQVSTGGSLVAISKNGKYLANGTETLSDRDPALVGGGGGGGGETFPIHISEVSTKKEIISEQQYYEIRSVTFSPNDKYIAGIVSDDSSNGIALWNAATGKEISRITNVDNAITITFSPDGQYLLAGNYDNTARVWEIATGKEVAHMIHDGTVNALAFSPDGKYVASGSEDGSVYVWEPSADQNISKKLDGWAVSQNSQFLATNDTPFIKVWKNSTGEEISKINFPAVPFYTARSNAIFDPTGRSILIFGECDEINESNRQCLSTSAMLWDINTEKKIFTLTQDSFINSIEFSSDGRFVISKGCDSPYFCEAKTDLHVWDTLTGNEVFKKTYLDSVSFATSPDGKYIVSFGTDTFVHVMELSTGKEVAQLSHIDPVDFVVFSPDTNHIICTGCDITTSRFGGYPACTQSTSVLWSLETGGEVTRFVHNGAVERRDSTQNWISPVIFTTNGNYIISTECTARYTNGSCYQNSATVWDTTTGKVHARQSYIRNKITALTLSLDNKYLATTGTDGSLHILEIATGKEISRLNLADAAKSITFSSDGNYIASSVVVGTGDLSDITTYQVWDINTGKEVFRAEHNCNYQCGSKTDVLGFSTDNKSIILGGIFVDTILQKWQADDLIANACLHIPRNLTRAEWAQFIGDAMPYQAVCHNLPIEPEVSLTPTVSP